MFLDLFTQSVGLLGRGISPSQGRYLHTEQTHTDIHASSGIGTHDPSVGACEDISYLRPRGHCDRQKASPSRKTPCSAPCQIYLMYSVKTEGVDIRDMFVVQLGTYTYLILSQIIHL
jgi:hypothetical protein